MIEKRVEENHVWHILNSGGECDICIHVSLGEMFVDCMTRSPDIEQAKEFHQALGEALEIAEKHNEK